MSLKLVAVVYLCQMEVFKSGAFFTHERVCWIVFVWTKKNQFHQLLHSASSTQFSWVEFFQHRAKLDVPENTKWFSFSRSEATRAFSKIDKSFSFHSLLYLVGVLPKHEKCRLRITSWRRNCFSIRCNIDIINPNASSTTNSFPSWHINLNAMSHIKIEFFQLTQFPVKRHKRQAEKCRWM